MKSRAAAETENCNIREIEENIEPKKAAREGKEHVRGIVWLPQICTLRQDAIGATTKIVYTEEMDESKCMHQRYQQTGATLLCARAETESRGRPDETIGKVFSGKMLRFEIKSVYLRIVKSKKFI